MALLEEKPVEDNARITMVFPKKMVKYMAIYGLSKGYTRARLIRDIITNWYEERLGEQSLETLFEDMTQKVYRIWQNKKSRYENFEEYLDQLENELRKRRSPVDEGSVKTLIRKLYEKNRGQ